MQRLHWLVPAVAILACQGSVVTDPAGVPATGSVVPEATLKKLAQKRIYFGHQSVGFDIVAGVEAIAMEQPGAGLKIVEARAPDALRTPALAHAKNGRNEDPLGKIQDFTATLERDGLGATTDIALFKFCYVDFPPGTDVDKVFAEYKGALAHLRQAYPSVRLVHVTSPLTVVQSGPKAVLKRVLGRPVGGAEANVVRERFNALMRAEYAGREPLFDLARVESTLPDGRTVTFQSGGKTFPALAGEYSSDGKHLNPAGARWVASHFLQTLATAAE